MTCRETRHKVGRICRKFVDEILGVEKVGAIVAVNDELFLAGEEAFADCDTTLFRDGLTQLLIEVTMHAV